MAGCSTGATLRVCLTILCFFIWCCAVTLITIGGFILGEAKFRNIRQLSESTEILVPSFVLIGAGVFLFIVGLLGCIGALKENKCCLALFFILLITILVGEIAAVALSYHFKHDLKSDLRTQMDKMIRECKNQTADQRADAVCKELDYVQTTFECCGSKGPEDWNKTLSVFPDSCCVNQTAGNCTHVPGNIRQDGCVEKTYTDFEKAFEWIFIGTLIVSILQVLGLVATMVLLCRSKETPYSHLDGQGYRFTD